MFVGLSLLLTACSTPPTFTQIGAVTVMVQTPGGTSKVQLEGEQLEAAKACLYATEEIQQEESKSELLQEILLLQVQDRYGDRMFELYTDENFKGNKKYYRNSCIFKVIKQS
jgi:hypothetical protein